MYNKCITIINKKINNLKIFQIKIIIKNKKNKKNKKINKKIIKYNINNLIRNKNKI